MQRHDFKRIAQTGFAASAAVALLVGCAGGGGGSDSGTSTEPVVVASWGGYFDDALQEAYFDDFTAETGIEVVIAPNDWARFTAMSEAKSSEWNSLDVGGALTTEWIEKDFVAELPADVPRSDLLDPAIADHMAGGYFNSFVIVYRKDAFPEPVMNWADVWDTERFPGKRAIVGLHEGFAEIALMADGVPADELFPLDFDRAFAKLGELKPELLITEGYAELRQAVDTGQVDIAIMPSGSAAQSVLASDGALEISWEQNVISEGGFPMSGYGPNQEGFEQLLAYMQDPERQAEFTNLSYYGSASSEAAEFIDPELLPFVTTYEPNIEQGVRPDYEWLAANTDEYVDRFSEWLTQ